MQPGKRLAIGKISLLTLGVLALLAALGLTYGLSPVIQPILTRALPNATQGLYRFESLKVRVRPFQGAIELRQVIIRTDSTAFARLAATDQAPATRWEAEIPTIIIRLRHPWKLWTSSAIQIEEIKIKKPVISLAYERSEGKTKPFTGQFRELLHQIIASRGRLSIERLTIEDGELRFNNQRKISRDAFIAKDLQARVDGFVVDTQTIRRPDRPFRLANFSADVGVEDYSLILADSAYELKAARIGFSSTHGEVFIEQAHLRPNLKKIRNLPMAARPTVAELKIENLGLGGVDIREWLENKRLELTSVRCIGPQLVLIQGGSNVQLSREEALQALKPIAESLRIRNISIVRGQFTRLAQVGPKKADVLIDQIGAFLQNVILDPAVPQAADSLVLEATTGSFRFLAGHHELAGSEAYIGSQEQRVRIQNWSLTTQLTAAAHQPMIALKGQSAFAQGLGLDDLLAGKFDLDAVKLTGVTGRIVLASPPQTPSPHPGQKPLISLPRVTVGRCELLASSLYLVQTNPNRFARLGRTEVLLTRLSLNGKGDALLPFTFDTYQVTAHLDSARFPLGNKEVQVTLSNGQWNSLEKEMTLARLAVFGKKDSSGGDPLRVEGTDVRLKGFDPYRLMANGALIADTLALRSGIIRLPYHQGQDTSFSLKLPAADFDTWLSPFADTLSLGDLTLGALQWEVYSETGNRLNLPKTSISSKKIYWRRNMAPPKNTFWYAQDLLLSLGKGGFGGFAFDSLSFSTQSGTLNLMKATYRDSIMEFALPQVVLRGWDWSQYLDHRLFVAQSLLLTSPRVAKLDLGQTPPGETTGVSWGKINGIAGAFRLDTLRIRNGAAALTPKNMPTLQASEVEADVTGLSLDSATWLEAKPGFRLGGIRIGFKMEKYVWTLPDSNYQISIGEIGFTNFDSALSIKNLELTPRPEADFSGMNAKWSIRTPELLAQGLNFQDFLNQRGIRLTSLGIFKPDIHWHVLEEEGQPIEEALTAAFQPLINRWGAISVGVVSIRNASLVRDFEYETSKAPVALQGLGLRLTGFSPDRQPAFRPGRLLYSRDFEIYLSYYERLLQQGDYRAAVYNIGYSSRSNRIEADSVVIQPTERTYAYYLKKGYVVDRLVARLKDISLQGVQGLGLLTRGAIRCNVLRIEEVDFSLFKERRLAQKPDRRPPMPQDLLRNAIMPIEIDTVFLPLARVYYSEITNHWETEGEFWLDSLRLQITNVSNLPPRNAVAQLEAHSLLMGIAPLSIKAVFPLADTTNSYVVEGKVGPMPLESLNPILGTGAKIQIRQGQSQGIEFTLFGARKIVTGKMRFAYTDLKLDIFDWKGKKQTVESNRRLLSALANSLVVKQNNPHKGRFRIGRVRYAPETWRFITGHWIKAFTDGALSSLGIRRREDRDEILEEPKPETKTKR